jgi:hypothetical protein
MIKTVPLPLLQQLATQVQTTIDINNGTENANISATNGMDWLNQWSARYAPELTGQFNPIANGIRLARTDCPWNSSHGRDAYVQQLPNGAISAGCHHASCVGKDWYAYRAAKEPGYQHGQDTSGIIHNNAPVTTGGWSPPKTLEHTPSQKPPALDLLLIPEVLRNYCKDVAYRLQAPIEYAMICLISMFATLIGHKLVIYAKQRDSWIVAPTIWGMLIGDPSAMKSPVLREVMGRLIKLNKAVYDNSVKEKDAHDAKIKDLQAEIDQLLKPPKAKSAPAPAPDSKEQLKTKRQELAALKANPPLLKRLLLQDVTVEKAQEMLSSMCAAVLILWDELSTLFKIMNKSGREADRGFFLSGWNGTDPSITDRIGRGTTIIDRLGILLLGGIQPGVLSKFISQAMDLFGNDGFMQRFQLVIFPSPYQDNWEYTDKKPDQASNQFLDDAVEFLYGWTPEQDINGPLYRCDKGEFIGVQFDDEAQALFRGYLTTLQQNLRDGSIDSNIKKEHYAKYPALMLKLALIFHVIKHVGSKSIPAKVDLMTATLAAAWTEYLWLHADKLYAIDKKDDETITVTALALLQKVKENKVTSGMTASVIAKKDWTGLKNTESVTDGLELLAENGWVRLIDKNTGKSGRPTKTIEIHPQIGHYLKERDQYIETKATPVTERPWLQQMQQLEDMPLMAASSLLLTEMDDEDDDYCPDWMGLIAAASIEGIAL